MGLTTDKTQQAAPSEADGKKTLTVEFLRSVMNYDQATGVLTWRPGLGRHCHEGRVAGTPNKAYVRVRLGGEQYQAHRLIWFYVYGEWPKQPLDHRDGNPLNNRIDNLRETNHRLNQQNRATAGTATRSGLLGAHKSDGGWRSCIRVSGKDRYLGTFRTPEAAHAAYMKAKLELHQAYATGIAAVGVQQ